jgi:alpha-tubulin suppressor-like RCC1 family protein
VGYKYPKYTTVATGVGHTCAINTNKEAYCWGDDFSGQIGNGPEPNGGNCSGESCEMMVPTAVNTSLIE